VQGIPKRNDIRNIILTPDKELSIFIHRTSVCVIIYETYAFKNDPVLLITRYNEYNVLFSSSLGQKNANFSYSHIAAAISTAHLIGQCHNV